MIKRNESKAKQEKSEKSNFRRWTTYSLVFVCCLTLASGFFFAARQHFSSIDYGMKNSRLRKQVDELEAEKRRLILAREVSLSPGEIKKAAKKAGMIEPVTSESDVAQLASSTREKAVPTTPATARSMVIKTAAVSAVPPTVTATYPKPAKVAKVVKKELPTE